MILAAGASTRMGRAKALLPWRGSPFVAHTVRLAAAAGCEPVVVVAGAAALPPEATESSTVVLNHDWARGQMSSLKTGVDAVPPGIAVMVLTVDRPHIRPQTVAALAAAAAQRPHAVWQPEFGTKRGHPVILPADLVQAVRDAPAESTLRDIVRHPEVIPRRRGLPCEDPAVLDNLDRPSDLERLPD
ncbi:MAG: nucleotidyltransferase family protein [Myxococcota bacterium]